MGRTQIIQFILYFNNVQIEGEYSNYVFTHYALRQSSFIYSKYSYFVHSCIVNGALMISME